MPREIEVDFSALSRRKIASDFETPCEHDPECYLWESTDGPVNVCNMGDYHLLRAYRKLLSQASLMYGGGGPNGDGAILAWESAARDYEDAVEAMLSEIRLRSLSRYI